MASPSSLVELGERYAALGLPAAARGAFLRALELSDDSDATAAWRLAELALAAGHGAAARDFANIVVKRDGGAAARVLLGRAQIVAGELSAARFSFTTALESASIAPVMRARARMGQATVAASTGDRPGAAATVMAGLGELLDVVAAIESPVDLIDTEITLTEELVTHAVSLGRADDVAERIDELAAKRPEAPVSLLTALLLAARQAHGNDVADSEVEAALGAELEARPSSRVTKLRLIARQLRRRHHDRAARAGAIEQLEAMATELTESAPSVADNVELARVHFLLAAAYENDPENVGRAEEAYRKGLALRPGHATAANRLALLTLARGDSEAALSEIERALRIDAGHGLAWRSAARVLEASSPGHGLPRAVARLLDAANPGAGAAAIGAPRLVAATAEVARGDVLEGMYTQGHRLKNLLGIIGSRTRSARKLAGADGELSEKLTDLEAEVTSLYNEWATYLRSMQTAGPVVEVVPVEPLIAEVVGDASAKAAVSIGMSVAGGVPDLRGDRLLLREALMNIVSNAADACSDNGGAVNVAVTAEASGRTPVIQIEVSDEGAGISRANLARIFAPGFTTKDDGSGVGLAIAERVVAAHHGRIMVDSKEGEGTTVTVTLPSDLGGFAGLAASSSNRGPEVE